jgi:MT0933-like antitoxin protein
MGLGDKFKNLTKQAQDAVAEHKDEIHDAVDRVSAAADQQTRGKYTAKIAKAGQKAGEAVDKFAEPGGAAESGRQPSDSDD